MSAAIEPSSQSTIKPTKPAYDPPHAAALTLPNNVYEDIKPVEIVAGASDATVWQGKDGCLWCNYTINDGKVGGWKFTGVQCLTCFPNDTKGVILCAFCAAVCHAGHELSKPVLVGLSMQGTAFCDCKVESTKVPCQSCTPVATIKDVKTVLGPLYPFVHNLSNLAGIPRETIEGLPGWTRGLPLLSPT